MREYALVILLVAAATYITTPLARRFAVRIKAMTVVRDRDVHAIPTPRLGGLAMFAGLVAGMWIAAQLPRLATVFQETTWIGVLAGGGIVCLVGALDDRFALDPLTKLAGQVVAAGAMVLGGVQLLWLPLPGPVGTLSLDRNMGVVATVILVVATMNAINFVDGLDGLAAGIVGIAALAFFSYSWLLSYVEGFQRATSPTLVTAILAGMCIGFLPHNFHPARLFMGDSGSMLIGLLLSAGTITLTGQVNVQALPPTAALPTVLPLLVPVAVFAVPFVDMLLAVIRRTWAGKAPWAPDKLHMHHRLLLMGHSHRGAVLIMYSWAALIAFAVVAAAFHAVPYVVLSITAGCGMLALVAINIPRVVTRWRGTH